MTAVLVLPGSLVLREDDLLRIDLRLVPARPGASFRLLLATPRKELFRHGEDALFWRSWSKLAWHISDFHPALWSHVQEADPVPEQFRYLLLSVDGVEPGDVVEVQNAGIFRAN